MQNENDPKNGNANTESTPTVEDKNLARGILNKLSIHSGNHLDKITFDLCVDMVSEMISKSQSGPKTNEKILGNTLAELADDVLFQTARADAYKWGYGYLQDRMEGLQRLGWAHDCDSEIEHRISVKHTCAETVEKPSPASQEISEVRKEKTTNRISFRKP